MQSERGIDLLHLSPLHQANQTLPTQAWDEFGPTRKEVLPALLFYRLGFLLFVWGMRLYFPETLFLSHNFWLTGYVHDFFFPLSLYCHIFKQYNSSWSTGSFCAPERPKSHHWQQHLPTPLLATAQHGSEQTAWAAQFQEKHPDGHLTSHTNPRAIQVSGSREKHDVPSSSQNNGLEEQMHRGQGAPITWVNCFPPPGREGEDPSRLINMLMIKGKFFCFSFFFKRLLLCNDCIYVFQRNKQSMPRQMDYPRNGGQTSPWDSISISHVY